MMSFNGKRKKRSDHETAAVYMECRKNHAATTGGHAVDGCGEYMPPPIPSLKCAVCGCHRNFHRLQKPHAAPGAVVGYSPAFIHRPRRFSSTSPSSSSSTSRSDAPISSIYPSAPQILKTLSSGLEISTQTTTTTQPAKVASGHAPTKLCFNDGKLSKSRKRFRTKFSAEQKEKMRLFAEELGWKMQRSDDEIVTRFCDDIGVCRSVLKVWMHNNKSRNTMGIISNNSYEYNGAGGLSAVRIESGEMHVAGNNGGKQKTAGGYRPRPSEFN